MLQTAERKELTRVFFDVVGPVECPEFHVRVELYSVGIVLCGIAVRNRI